MTEQDQARIAARYPKRSLLDYVVGGGLAAGILGMIVLVIANGLQQANPPVAAMVRDFKVVSPTEITARLVVQRKNPAEEAQCRVYAQAESYETVGETKVTIPPGDELLTTFDLSLNTIKEATALRVENCTITG